MGPQQSPAAANTGARVNGGGSAGFYGSKERITIYPDRDPTAGSSAAIAVAKSAV